MLKELMNSLNFKENLPAAFKKCGLSPIDRNKVLERIPSVEEAEKVARNLDKELLKKLEVRRFGDGKKKPRGKKVPAGQSYTKDLETTDEEDSEEEGSQETSEEEEDDVEEQSENSDVGVGNSNEEFEYEELLPDLDEPSGSGMASSHGADSSNRADNGSGVTSGSGVASLSGVASSSGVASCRMASYVVANYEGQWFLAEVYRDQEGVDKNYTRLNYMQIKGNNSFAWGKKPDLHEAFNEDILLRNVLPEPVNSRGNLGIKKKDLQIVLSRMVLVYYRLFSFNILRYFSENLSSKWLVVPYRYLMEY
jgi:hypothetical protein